MVIAWLKMSCWYQGSEVRRGGLVGDHRKWLKYNQGQNSISERTTCPTLKQCVCISISSIHSSSSSRGGSAVTFRCWHLHRCIDMALHSLIVHYVKKMGKVLPTLCLLHGACACVCVSSHMKSSSRSWSCVRAHESQPVSFCANNNNSNDDSDATTPGSPCVPPRFVRMRLLFTLSPARRGESAAWYSRTRGRQLSLQRD